MRGFITPTRSGQSCQPSIRVFIINFPIVLRVPIRREVVMEVECRGIFITRRTSILCPIDSLQFHQFVYFATNESRKVSLLCRDQGRLIAMRNRRKCNFLDEVTRGNNCLFIGYRRFIKFLLSSKRVGVHKGSISKAFPNKNDE